MIKKLKVKNNTVISLFRLFASTFIGAGWGGCAVSLIPQEKLSVFLESVNQLYYSKSPDLQKKFAEAAFATKPSAGITIVLP